MQRRLWPLLACFMQVLLTDPHIIGVIVDGQQLIVGGIHVINFVLLTLLFHVMQFQKKVEKTLNRSQMLGRYCNSSELGVQFGLDFNHMCWNGVMDCHVETLNEEAVESKAKHLKNHNLSNVDTTLRACFASSPLTEESFETIFSCFCFRKVLKF